jgi:hypothetical protein
MDGWVVFIAAGVAVLLIRSFLPAYLGEKGKNLATKEDIAEITNKVEAVRLQYSGELERLRDQLSRLTFEHQTRFSKLHDRRADAIDGLYKRLVRTSGAFHQLLISGEEDVAAKSNAGKAAQDFVDFFGEHRLYLEPELLSALGDFDAVLREAWATFAFDSTKQEAGLPHHERERRLKAWRRARDIVRDESPKLRERIEGLMREMLAAPGDAE